MFWLVVGWVDGFGADTTIKGIYPTREEAIKHCKFSSDNNFGYSDKVMQVNYGEITVDYYDLPKIHERPPKKKSKKRG